MHILLASPPLQLHRSAVSALFSDLPVMYLGVLEGATSFRFGFYGLMLATDIRVISWEEKLSVAAAPSQQSCQALSNVYASYTGTQDGIDTAAGLLQRQCYVLRWRMN